MMSIQFYVELGDIHEGFCLEVEFNKSTYVAKSTCDQKYICGQKYMWPINTIFIYLFIYSGNYSFNYSEAYKITRFLIGI